MTYPPPPGTPDPYGQQQPPDPFAAPPAYDPTSPPPPPPPAYDPYGQQPVTPSNPFTQPPPTPQNPYDPYAQQQSPAPQYPPPAQYGQPYGATPQYPYAQTGDPNKQNGLAIGSMVSGIVGLLAACCCTPIGFLGGIAGVIMGFLARKQIAERGGQGNGMALAGIITGAVGILIAIVGVILSLSGFNQNLYNDIINSGNALY